MSGVRQVIETFHVPLDPTKDFTLGLPTRFLHDEPHRDRIVDIWRDDVVPAINRLCRARKSGLINRSLKRSVFQTSMENVCRDFSRRTDNINVEFRCEEQCHQYHHHRKTTTYSLVFTRLSAVMNNLRQARYCVAEIPANPHHQPTAEAQVVSTLDSDNDHDVSLLDVPLVRSEIVATSFPIQYGDQPYDNPPVACEVTAIVEQDEEEDDENENSHDHDVHLARRNHNPEPHHRSALDRMRELDSIKAFLTPDEYTLKRQAILDSI